MTGQVCIGSTCVTSCPSGQIVCSGFCVFTATDPDNCGGCGRACAFTNGAGVCIASRCALGPCNPGFGDCDGNTANGCETNVNTSVTSCGRCGNACSFPNAGATCTGGTCGLGACTAGFGDCDGTATNGCEVDLRVSNAHCGACGRACTGGASCVAGTCTYGGGVPLNVTTGTTTINTVRATAEVAAGATAVVVSNVNGMFAAGQRVILHQTQGGGAALGTYEYGQIASAAGNVLILRDPVSRAYTSSGGARAQVVVVEERSAVNISPGAALTAPAWDGNSGGILALDVGGTLTNAGTINMTDHGFRGRGHACVYRCSRGFQGEGENGFGGVTIARNGIGGGGGGAGQDDGAGGGGAYGSTGGNGGSGTCGICREACPIPGGAGGSAAGATSLATNFLLGGAGGEGGADEDGGNPGRGGNGGGTVLLRVGALTNTGTIITDGGRGQDGQQGACGGVGCGMGGGGGGSGGGVRIASLGPVTLGGVFARGVIGGLSTCGTSRGGTGGNGRVSVLAPSVAGTSSPAFTRE